MKACLSQWDSKVFGVKVGTLSLGVEWESPEIHAQIQDENRGAFDVVFAKGEGFSLLGGHALALDWRYDMEIANFPNEEAEEAARIEADERVLDLAANVLGPVGRFLRDPRLKDQSGEFYREWCRSSSGRIYSLKGRERDCFAVISVEPDGTRRLELVAVSESARGKGYGTDLLIAVLQGAGPEEFWRVRVSASNWRAIRFYESLGFRIKSVSTAFHVWTR